MSFFYVDEEGVIRVKPEYYEQSLIDFLAPRLSLCASLREYIKDVPGNFKTVKEYLLARECPAFLCLCPYSKKQRTEGCNSLECWSLPIKNFDINQLEGDKYDLTKVLAKVVRPAICEKCGSASLKLAWGKKTNVKYAGYTFHFNNILYLICNDCGEKYVSAQDRQLMDKIIDFIVYYEDDSENKTEISNEIFVTMPADKIGAELLLRHKHYIDFCFEYDTIDLSDITLIVGEEYQEYPEEVYNDYNDGEDVIFDDE